MSSGVISLPGPPVEAHPHVKFSEVVTAALTATHDHHQNEVHPSIPAHQDEVRTTSRDHRPPLRLATIPSRPVSLPDTPTTRTGPPRSLSFQFSPSGSPVAPHLNSVDGQLPNSELFDSDLGDSAQFASSHQAHPPRRQSTFRGALDPELVSSSIDRDSKNKKGKAREASGPEESRSSTRWLESIDERPPTIFDEPQGQAQPSEREGHMSRYYTTGFLGKDDPQSQEPLPSEVQRSQSQPPPRSIKRSGGSEKWGKLRALIPSSMRQSPSTVIAQSVAPADVNITDELITGGLSNLMLGLWFDRDDKGHRRIPVLLHRLRIRISDSLHPLHAQKAVFRIECEYANGASRWVIYRQLRDFLSLHTHYTISNTFSMRKDALPEFPLTSLPYFNFLKKASTGSQARQADFALLQREALENYLIKLIRAVMFHPSANRLAGFLEISSLFIAQAGGVQYKAGFLWFEPLGSATGLGRKSTGRTARKQSRWCIVRDSYVIVVEDPGEVIVWDVFLLDSDFKIVRPISYYRKGLHLLRPEPADREFHTRERVHEVPVAEKTEIECFSIMTFIRNRVARLCGIGHRSAPNVDNVETMEDKSAALPEHGHIRHDTASSGSSVESVSHAPMLDPSTHVRPLEMSNPHQVEQEERRDQEQQRAEDERRKRRKPRDVSKHTFYVENSQMRLKLFARNERQMLQWITALEKAADTCHYVTNNRFDSFAPIRTNVAAQWLVDGRDYMWNLSRALMMAKESIYIHDWWLSPELYLRRPDKEKYRLDKILERKAKEGVKIYIILYLEVSSRTTPTDSGYAKQKLSSLHENIMIQRSPSHFQTGTFYWAHHEKLCVVDQTIAFMGGIDLCFGRWDTPQHVLVDDPELSPEKTEIWPGKDYSNPRVLDFHTLNKPEEDMYDRSKVPRMPWHDVGMQVVGQPARDLARHFLERWNWLLRIKNHSRIMPFLLPPPEFKTGELEAMGLTGTCELQICRSAGPWSLGTPHRIEHSIQNAYIAAIDNSEHFVYLENQFFISSTIISDVQVENGIGDALVRRIIRADKEGTPWKCCIIIPLFPGFPCPVDDSDASAMRIIIHCQNHSLFRGENSIYARLREEGINPNEYIRVFSLRNWGKLRDGVLTTEIVYIHGKICIVDDRLAIIGSANINERSQRGNRDSELAAVVRDTDLIDGMMAGRPFQVGRFAHTLRVRLMREHVGVDVDALAEEDLPRGVEHAQDVWDPNAEQETRPGRDVTEVGHERVVEDLLRRARSVEDAIATMKEDTSLYDHGLSPVDERKELGFTSMEIPSVDVPGGNQPPPTSEAAEKFCADQPDGRTQPKAGSSAAASQEAFALADGSAHAGYYEPSQTPSDMSDHLDEKGTTQKRAPSRKQKFLPDGKHKPWTPTPPPDIDPNVFEDPIADTFWEDVWTACAEHNTEIYRKVFHAVPDDTVTTWKQYKEFIALHERFVKTAGAPRHPKSDGTHDEPHLRQAKYPSATPQASTTSLQDDDGSYHFVESIETSQDRKGSERSSPAPMPKPTHEKETSKSKKVKPFDKAEMAEMEQLLKHTRGHLVLHPKHFLEAEYDAENFLFNADKLMPLPIYD